MTSDKDSLLSLRNEINKLDAEMIEILAKRRVLSEDAARSKDAINSPEIRDAGREEQLLAERIAEGRKRGLDSYFVTRVFHEIIDDSLRLQHHYLQKKLNNFDVALKRIAFHGIDGSYCQLATKQYFGSDAEKLRMVGRPSFQEVIEAVHQGHADYAMLPIENTISGGINDIYDLLLDANLFFIGEEIFKVDHCLVGLPGATMNNIKKVCCSFLAFSDCRNMLSKLTGVQIETISDSAMAAKHVKDLNDPAVVAIASDATTKLYGLKVIQRDIANNRDNYIRYLLVAKEPRRVDERIPCKTSIVFSTAHQSGSLVEALLVFRNRGINLTKLESRPVHSNPWEEMFYLDLEGNCDVEPVSGALKELTRCTQFIRILGSYPASNIPKTAVAPKALANQEAAAITVSPELQALNQDKPAAKKKKSYPLSSLEHKPEPTIINVKGVKIGGPEFVVMAGPCSVESEQQIMECARHAKECGARILRGGCFKPRSSPYSFQGLGYEGLELLAEAGRAYGLPIVTEVMSPEDVEGIAAHADILQIGARNMQNFTLLKALGRTHLPILLKRGLSSSLDDLLNAAEYILAHGNQQVILCERGIRTFETATRSTLDISAVPVIKRESHLPIIIDPSHAAGERDLVPPLALAAKAVGAHGIIVEFHPEPEKALSDGPQALRFPQFQKLMKDLLA
jgi:chorismate mutase/prephenate dehydratase